MAGSFWPERDNSRNRVVPVRVRVFALETLDEIGKLRRNGARLPAVLPRLRRQRLEAAVAVAQRPVQQCVYRNRCALGSGNLVVAGGNLFGAPCELTARQGLENKIRNRPHLEEGDFSALASIGKISLGQKHKAAGRARAPGKSCVGSLRPAAAPVGSRLPDRRERETRASPASACADRRTGNGGRRSSRWIRACGDP